MERLLQQAQGTQSQLTLHGWHLPLSMFPLGSQHRMCLAMPRSSTELGLPEYLSLQVTPELYLLSVGICGLAHLQPSEGHLEKCLGVTFPLD